MIYGSRIKNFKFKAAKDLYIQYCEILNNKFELEVYAKDTLIRAYECELAYIISQSKKLKNTGISEDMFVSDDRVDSKCEKKL